MLRPWCIFFTVAMLAAFAAAASVDASAPDKAEAAAPPETPLPAAVAKVGDEIISGFDFQQGMAYRWKKLTAARGVPPEVNDRFRQDTLEELVDGRIIRILARNAGIAVSDEEIESAYQRGREVLGSEEAYQAYLEREGYTESDVYEQLRLRIMTEKYIEEQTRGLTVGSEELHDYYQHAVSTGKAVRKQPTMDIALIFMRADTAGTQGAEAVRARIAAARERILAGESFQDVARELSEDPISAPQGGVLIEVHPAELFPEAAKLLKDLEPGEVTEPYLAESGWYLLTVLARNAPGVIPLDKIVNKLEAEILAPRRAERLRQRIDAIRLTLDIQIYEDEAAAVPAAK